MIPIVICVAVAIIVCFCCINASEAKLKREWPPIDDDEFMRRCTPGTSRETALRVRRIISEQLGVPYSQIYPEQRFVEDLFCD